MQRCRECGQPVEFRFINGRCVPLHTEGGCSNAPRNGATGLIKRSTESECRWSACPKCGSGVYFIRHNGGSVWIEPPLGPPWERHPCFEDHGRKVELASPISDELMARLGQTDGLIMGVVRTCELSIDRKKTILQLVIGAAEPLVVLVNGGADTLLGQLVIIHAAERVIYWASEPRFSFRITAVLAGPYVLTGRGGALRLPISDEQFQKVRDEIRLGELSKVQHRALQRFRNEGLDSAWKLSELLALVPLIEGKAKDRALHMASVMVIEHAERCGDCTGAATLASSLVGPKRQRLIAWFWKHSPIRVDLSRKRGKALIFKPFEGERRPFSIAAAKKDPI